VTVLDPSVIIAMLEGVSTVVESVEDRGQPYLTSSLCVFEVIEGEVGSGTPDVDAIRREFGGARTIDLDDEIALEAGRMQDQLLDDGERIPARDLLVAATARSTGDELGGRPRARARGLVGSSDSRVSGNLTVPNQR
jgi:predicted nucleic acid-binding protein